MYNLDMKKTVTIVEAITPANTSVWTPVIRRDGKLIESMQSESDINKAIGQSITATAAFDINAEITKGYETWKNLFLSVDHIREKYGVKVLAYGHPKENEDKVYQVLDVPSMEIMQEALKDPDLAKLRTDAGVNVDSQEVVFLVE